MSLTITDGVLVFVEADKKGQWFSAKDWQRKKFFEVMKFGTMKSMCYPNPYVKSEVFEAPNRNKYKFHIYNDWGPVYIENISTKKKREIKYYELYKSNNNTINYKLSQIKN